MNDATTTVLTTTGGTTDVTSNYVNVDWSTYQPLKCYDPWGVYPYNLWPVPYYPQPTYYPVTTTVYIPRGFTEAEMDDLAERVAKKVIAAKKKSRAVQAGK